MFYSNILPSSTLLHLTALVVGLQQGQRGLGVGGLAGARGTNGVSGSQQQLNAELSPATLLAVVRQRLALTTDHTQSQDARVDAGADLIVDGEDGIAELQGASDVTGQVVEFVQEFGGLGVHFVQDGVAGLAALVVDTQHVECVCVKVFTLYRDICGNTAEFRMCSRRTIKGHISIGGSLTRSRTASTKSMRAKRT